MSDVRMRGFKERMEVEAFKALIRGRIVPVGEEVLPIGQAGGRVLAEAVVSQVRDGLASAT